MISPPEVPDIFSINSIPDLIKNKEGYIKLAIQQKNNGAGKTAAAILKKYLDMVGLDIGVGMNLADIYRASSDFSKAEEIYSKINNKWPEYPSAYSGRALSLELQNKRIEAIEILNEAIKYVDKFKGNELKSFCINYARFTLKFPQNTRNNSIFDILKQYHDDFLAIALYELRNTYYKNVGGYCPVIDIIFKKIKLKEKFLITRPGNIEVIAALNKKYTPQLKINAGISEPIELNKERTFRIWLEQYNEVMKMSDAVMLMQTKLDLVTSYVNLLEIPNDKCVRYIGELGVWLALLEKLLKSHKILFISSFSESIKKNKNNLNKIHSFRYDFNIENIFEIQAPFTLAGQPEKSWILEKEALSKSISNIDYDIAFVSCGGYGHSVCLEIFNKNKSAIYIGGLLQTFFGIMGGRWNSNTKFMSQYTNEFWTKALHSEIPKDSYLVENSCYW